MLLLLGSSPVSAWPLIERPVTLPSLATWPMLTFGGYSVAGVHSTRPLFDTHQSEAGIGLAAEPPVMVGRRCRVVSMPLTSKPTLVPLCVALVQVPPLDTVLAAVLGFEPLSATRSYMLKLPPISVLGEPLFGLPQPLTKPPLAVGIPCGAVPLCQLPSSTPVG